MYSRKHLSTLAEEIQKKEEVDIYQPGDLSKVIKLSPNTGEEVDTRHYPYINFNPKGRGVYELVTYEPPWKRPDDIKKQLKAMGPEMQRYNTGYSLRKWGKEIMGKRLQMIGMPHQVVKPGSIPQMKDLRQPPFAFVDVGPLPTSFLDGVPDWEEAPFGFSLGQLDTVGKGFWGELWSGLTSVGQQLIQTQEAKYQAEIARVGQQVTPIVSQAALVPTGISTYLLIGGAVLAFFLFRGKPSALPSRKIRRRRIRK